MTRPTAAPSTFPMPGHRTVAEIDRTNARLISEAADGTRRAEAVRAGITLPLDFHYGIDAPPRDEWVLAYWPHMRSNGGPKARIAGGWYPTRCTPNGWQAQFLSFRCYPAVTPRFWTALLQPETEAA